MYKERHIHTVGVNKTTGYLYLNALCKYDKTDALKY